MPGGGGQRSVLAPSRHPPVDELGVAGEHRVRPDAEPFGHAGPEPLDQRVGALGQPQHDLGRAGLAQVEGDGPATAPERAGRQAAEHAALAGQLVDAHHLGAEVGQQHPEERHRPERGQFDDANSRERPGHLGQKVSPFSAFLRSSGFGVKRSPYFSANWSARSTKPATLPA